MKLSRIFFAHLVLLLGALLLILSVVSYYTLKNIEIQRYKDTLKKSIILLEPQLGGDLDRQVKRFSKELGERITIINPKGVVVAESHFDKSQMENHAARPEIVEARKNGWGSSVRYSATLHKDLLYVAKRLKDGSFLRVAIELATIKQNFYALWLKFLAIFALFAAVALWISYVLSRKIDKEIGKIVAFLQDLSQKNYTTLKVNFAKEFEIIGSYLNQLSAKLKKREDKKNKYTKKLKNLTRQRTELISAISHEFKNPVAIIHGYAETLLDDPDMPPKIRQRFIQKIYSASQKISYMIDRLALAIKMESGKIEPQMSRFDLCEVAREAVKFLKDRYKNRNVHVECRGDNVVVADKQMIQAIIENLVDNALKYSELDVQVKIEGSSVSVIDRGVGLKENEIEKITKKFYRVQNSWDNSMGLGLYIVSYLLELHGSRLQIDSSFGKGSCFCFELPTSKLQG